MLAVVKRFLYSKHGKENIWLMGPQLEINVVNVPIFLFIFSFFQRTDYCLLSHKTQYDLMYFVHFTV